MRTVQMNGRGFMGRVPCFWFDRPRAGGGALPLAGVRPKQADPLAPTLGPSLTGSTVS